MKHSNSRLGSIEKIAAVSAIALFFVGIYTTLIGPVGTPYNYVAFAGCVVSVVAAAVYLRKSRDAERRDEKVGVESIGGEDETITDVEVSQKFDKAVKTIGGKRTKIRKIRAGMERTDDTRRGDDRGRSRNDEGSESQTVGKKAR